MLASKPKGEYVSTLQIFFSTSQCICKHSGYLANIWWARRECDKAASELETEVRCEIWVALWIANWTAIT